MLFQFLPFEYQISASEVGTKNRSKKKNLFFIFVLEVFPGKLLLFAKQSYRYRVLWVDLYHYVWNLRVCGNPQLKFFSDLREIFFCLKKRVCFLKSRKNDFFSIIFFCVLFYNKIPFFWCLCQLCISKTRFCNYLYVSGTPKLNTLYN